MAATNELQVSHDLALPLNAVTQKLAFLGRTGSGKTYGAMKLAEQMLDAGAQVVALDPVGVWWGLRLAADGRSPGIAIPVFGGLHADVPLEPSAGALVADLIVDRGISVVLDVSQFETDADKARFAADFFARFFFRKKASPSAVFLFVEECQEFFPQNIQRGEERMLHAGQRLVRLGRNFGIGVGMITQRPQDVNKKALNQAECVFAFQTTGPQERKAIDGWMADKGLDLDIAADLPKLPVGTAHVWSPSWLGISRKVKVDRKRTFNASATPEVGKAAQRRELAPIDLERLRTDMAATIEKARAEDPAELRRRIAELERAARATAKAAPVVDVDAIARAEDAARAAALREVRAVSTQIANRLVMIVDRVARIGHAHHDLKSLTEDVGLFLKDLEPAPQSVTARPASARVVEDLGARSPEKAVTRPAPSTRRSESDGLLGKGEQRIIDAIAELKAIGVDPPTRAQAGIFSGYDLTGGTPSRYVGRLVGELGLLTIPSQGQLDLTPAGAARANAAAAPRTLAELHQRVFARLNTGERKILEVLIAAYPNALSRADAGAAVGYDLTGGTPSRYVGKLTGLGFAEIPRTGQLKAGEVLFPEGLR